MASSPPPHATRGPDDLYVTPPPWDIGCPQPTFQSLADAGAIRGRVLDVGCGTGEHVLLAAGLGLDATGIDLAGTALATAEQKARDRSLPARFMRHDVRKLVELGESFDTVFDCGLFHIFDGDDLAAYVDGVRSVLVSGGRYFMLCFSDQQSAEGWPRVHRLARAEITAAFADGWRIDTIEPATIDITTDPDGVRAWFVRATRG